MLTSFVARALQTKTIQDVLCIPLRLANTQNIIGHVWWGCEPRVSFTDDGMEGGAVTFKTTRQFWARLNIFVILFSNCTRAFILLIWSRKPFTQKVTVFLFLIVPNWKQPSWFFIGERINNLQYFHTKGKHSAMKKKWSIKPQKDRGNLKCILSSERRLLESLWSVPVLSCSGRGKAVESVNRVYAVRGGEGRDLSRCRSWIILRSWSYFAWGCNGVDMHHTFAKIHRTSKHSEWASTHTHVNYRLGWFYNGI